MKPEALSNVVGRFSVKDFLIGVLTFICGVGNGLLEKRSGIKTEVLPSFLCLKPKPKRYLATMTKTYVIVAGRVAIPLRCVRPPVALPS